MGKKRVEANNMAVTVNTVRGRAAAAGGPMARRILTEEEGSVEFAKFTRSLGVEPKDW